MTIQPSTSQPDDDGSQLSLPHPAATTPSLSNLNGPPIIAHASSVALPPTSGYGTPPLSTGQATPPPLSSAQPTYIPSAYPEHLRNTAPQQGHYQAPVPGLNGWNDLPTHIVAGLSGRKKGTSSPGSGTSSPTPLAALDDPGAVLSSVENPKSVVKEAFLAAMERVKIGVEPAQRRMVEDTGKRLDSLYQRMDADQIPQHILAMAVQLATALNSKDFTTANTVVTSLMTTSFDQEGKWVLGAKRLVELSQRLAS